MLAQQTLCFHSLGGSTALCHQCRLEIMTSNQKSDPVIDAHLLEEHSY